MNYDYIKSQVKKLSSKTLGLFFQGTLYFIPIFIPLYIIYSVFTSIDGWIKSQLHLEMPGLGLLLAFVALTILGFAGQVFLTQSIKNALLKWLEKAPIIKTMYHSVRDLLQAFVGKEKKFNQPVLVKLNNQYNLEKIGFITQQDLEEWGIEKEKISVYFPHSYAFSGEMFIVPRSQVTLLDKKSPDVMKFILSAGVSKS